MAERAGEAFGAGTTRGEALACLRALLAAAGIEEAPREARLLLGAALDLDAAALAAWPERAIGADGAGRLAAYARRRAGREPVARILGEQEFWGLPFRLAPATLVPRPDTETVVAAALDLVRGRAAPPRILDLGTGSGCILVALLTELPEASGVGTDRSQEALATARLNARLNGVGARAFFAACDWAAAIAPRCDIVVSNPPYIASGTIPGLAPEVSGYDPPAALDGGPDGLAAYRAILAELPRLLAPDGRAVIEIGFDQARAVAGLAAAAGLARVAVRPDLGGRDRAVVLAVAGE